MERTNALTLDFDGTLWYKDFFPGAVELVQKYSQKMGVYLVSGSTLSQRADDLAPIAQFLTDKLGIEELEKDIGTNPFFFTDSGTLERIDGRYVRRKDHPLFQEAYSEFEEFREPIHARLDELRPFQFKSEHKDEVKRLQDQLVFPTYWNEWVALESGEELGERRYKNPYAGGIGGSKDLHLVRCLINPQDPENVNMVHVDNAQYGTLAFYDPNTVVIDIHNNHIPHLLAKVDDVLGYLYDGERVQDQFDWLVSQKKTQTGNAQFQLKTQSFDRPLSAIVLEP